MFKPYRTVFQLALVCLFVLGAQAQIFTSSFNAGAGDTGSNRLDVPPAGIGPGYIGEVGRAGGPNPGAVFANGAWNVTGGNVDWVGSYWQDATQAFFGGPGAIDNGAGRRSLELNGFGCSAQDVACGQQSYSAAGKIESTQNFTLIGGNLYRLTFYLAGNPDEPNATLAQAGVTKIIPVTGKGGFLDSNGAEIGGGFTGTFSWTFVGPGVHSRDNMGWQMVEWFFVPSATVVGARLFFESTTRDGGTDFARESWGPAIDEIRLEDLTPGQVPEPSTYALLGAGLAAIAMIRRRA